MFGTFVVFMWRSHSWLAPEAYCPVLRHFVLVSDLWDARSGWFQPDLIRKSSDEPTCGWWGKVVEVGGAWWSLVEVGGGWLLSFLWSSTNCKKLGFDVIAGLQFPQRGAQHWICICCARWPSVWMLHMHVQKQSQSWHDWVELELTCFFCPSLQGFWHCWNLIIMCKGWWKFFWLL